MKKLTAIEVKKSGDGTLRDGGGLMLKKKGVTGKWVWRYTHLGRKRDMGLGSWPTITLAEARKLRDSYALQLAQGIDPLVQKREATAAARAKQERDDPSFQTLVDIVFEAKKATLREDGTRGRWLSPLTIHAIPKIGRKLGSELTRHDIYDVLKPIWRTKHPTAVKLLRRIGIVLKQSRTMGYPVDPDIVVAATAMLGAYDHRVTHIPASDWRNIPTIYHTFGDTSGGRCNQWIILTLVRMEPARLARVSEIDFDTGIWTVPADRMKGTKSRAQDFRVPLPDPCIEIAREAQSVGSDLIFPGQRTQRAVTNVAVEQALTRSLSKLDLPHATPHGFRTSFRSWVQDTEACTYDVAETVLAHVVGSHIERSYARSDMLDRRRIVMESWSSFVLGRSCRRCCRTLTSEDSLRESIRLHRPH